MIMRSIMSHVKYYNSEQLNWCCKCNRSWSWWLLGN